MRYDDKMMRPEDPVLNFKPKRLGAAAGRLAQSLERLHDAVKERRDSSDKEAASKDGR